MARSRVVRQKGQQTSTKDHAAAVRSLQCRGPHPVLAGRASPAGETVRSPRRCRGNVPLGETCVGESQPKSDKSRIQGAVLGGYTVRRSQTDELSGDEVLVGRRPRTGLPGRTVILVSRCLPFRYLRRSGALSPMTKGQCTRSGSARVALPTGGGESSNALTNARRSVLPTNRVRSVVTDCKAPRPRARRPLND